MGTGGKRDIRRSKGIINEKEDLHLENNISADPINIGSRLELFYSSKNNSQLILDSSFFSKKAHKCFTP